MALAREMNTGANGTSMLDLANAARKHGLSMKGVKLTMAGLRKQRLPLIALIGGGPYVILDELSPKQITIWDPNSRKPWGKAFSTRDWQRIWSGIALVPEEHP